jgi:hypothetical protein
MKVYGELNVSLGVSSTSRHALRGQKQKPEDDCRSTKNIGLVVHQPAVQSTISIARTEVDSLNPYLKAEKKFVP